MSNRISDWFWKRGVWFARSTVRKATRFLKWTESHRGRVNLGFACDDCHKEDPAMFILSDKVWRSIAAKREVLCFDCTERRLGRLICWDDLKPCQMTEECRLGLRIEANTAKSKVVKS